MLLMEVGIGSLVGVFVKREVGVGMVIVRKNVEMLVESLMFAVFESKFPLVCAKK